MFPEIFRELGIQKPRFYHLPLAAQCREACAYCPGIGAKTRQDRSFEGIRQSLKKAESGPYGAVLLPCNIWYMPEAEAILEMVSQSGLTIIAQVNAANLRQTDALARVEALAGKFRLAINFIFDSVSLDELSVLERLSRRHFLYATLVAARHSQISNMVQGFPPWFRERLFFQFPYAFSVPKFFLECTEVHQRISQVERENPGFRVRPAPGIDCFDPRIPDDRNLEPLIDPEFRTSAAAADPIEISVVIPSYNNKLYLSNTLKHLFAQDFPKSRFEVVLVDDGSDDGTRETIRDLLASIGAGVNFSYIFFPRVRPRQMGDSQFRAGVARNLGVKHARGKILFFLDSDILLPPNYLSRLAMEHRVYDVIQGKRIQLKREVSSQFTVYDDIEIGRDTYVTDEGYWEAFQNNTKDWMLVDRPWRYTCTYALSIKRDAFEKIGWIRRNYTYYGYEDTELGFDLYEAGFRLHLSAERVYHLDHRVHRSEFFNSFRRKKILLAHSADTFYRNTLDEGIYQHLDWLFQPLLGFRVWLGESLPQAVPVLAPFYRYFKSGWQGKLPQKAAARE